MRPVPENAFKRRLADRSVCQLGYWLSLNSMSLTEIAAGAGFDWLLLDMEHSSCDLESVDKHLLAARHGGDTEFVVRVPSIDGSLIKRLMDAGVTINRPPRDGHMAFVRTPDGISIELLQDGTLPPQEPWASMANTGVW